MKKSSNLQFFLMFLVFLFIILGIGKYFIDIIIKEEGISSDQASTEVITISEDRKLAWEEISEMILNCEVKQVFQSHDLRVSVVTHDDKTYWSHEPKIEDILKLSDQANASCDKEIIQVTE